MTTDANNNIHAGAGEINPGTGLPVGGQFQQKPAPGASQSQLTEGKPPVMSTMRLEKWTGANEDHLEVVEEVDFDSRPVLDTLPFALLPDPDETYNDDTVFELAFTAGLIPEHRGMPFTFLGGSDYEEYYEDRKENGPEAPTDRKTYAQLVVKKAQADYFLANNRLINAASNAAAATIADEPDLHGAVEFTVNLDVEMGTSCINVASVTNADGTDLLEELDWERAEEIKNGINEDLGPLIWMDEPWEYIRDAGFNSTDTDGVYTYTLQP
ncbi:hypothetical protein [Leifsonia sp. Leaf264]|uniref:hypothetical protein n=1 Tax=Leifsonia sp. Leaf264 TaxID=1736314 RepID=UPI0006FAF925|nr:hypothetical protein [Leifsonia sp. Leaf264]KQO98718.1 hypothetical protein ASF30_11695 [Leifsonia sp. Leaf264]